MIKGTIQQEDITLVNLYAPNRGAPKYVKQILMDVQGETDRKKVMVGDVNTPLTSMDRSSRQKINKETAAALEDTPSHGCNQYLQSISPQSGRIYTLFKCMCNVF